MPRWQRPLESAANMTTEKPAKSDQVTAQLRVCAQGREHCETRSRH